MGAARLDALGEGVPVRPSWSRRCGAVVVAAGIVFVSACSSNQGVTTPSSSATVAGTSSQMALGTTNPVQGDCTTNTSEAATSVGYVVLQLTADSFQAEIHLQAGSPGMTYGVFMQQVPGSCPQQAANAGSLTTDSTGRGQASTTVPRVAGATTFYVQLVPGEAGAPDYTSDRISAAP